MTPPKAPKQSTERPVAITAELPPELIARIDAWRAAQKGAVSREEAVTQLLVAHFWPNL